MDQPFGAWTPTGKTRGELEAETRRLQHLRTFRELQSERRAARRALRSAAIATAIGSLLSRIMGGPIETAPACCPA